MNAHAQTHHSDHIRSRDDFSVRFRKNLMKELVQALKAARCLFGFFFAFIFGVVLFISEFDFVKKFFAVAFIPVVLFFVGKYLTILPIYLVIAVAITSILSLSSSEEGAGLSGWFSNSIGSFSEAFSGAPSAETSLSQKLLGFMALSAVASFFIIFLI